MKINELVLAKCIDNWDEWDSKPNGLEINKYYVVTEINIGQSNSNIMINGSYYNSIMFEYFDSYMRPLNIYKVYSPYKLNRKE